MLSVNKTNLSSYKHSPPSPETNPGPACKFPGPCRCLREGQAQNRPETALSSSWSLLWCQARRQDGLCLCLWEAPLLSRLARSSGWCLVSYRQTRDGPHLAGELLQVPRKHTVQHPTHSSELCTGVLARGRCNKQKGAMAGCSGSPSASPRLPLARAPAMLCLPTYQMWPRRLLWREKP